MDTLHSAAAQPGSTTVTREVSLKLQELTEAVEIERRQSRECDWYQVFFSDDVTGDLLHVRAPAFKVDADGRKQLSAKGRYRMFHPVDVALNVWGACGAEDYTFVCVLKGPMVVATAADMAEYVQMVGGQDRVTDTGSTVSEAA